MKSIFWFKDDLRLEDNPGLYEALSSSDSVAPIFIFDNAILSLPNEDLKTNFIWESVQSLKSQLRSFGSDLIIAYGDSAKILNEYAVKFKVDCIFLNKSMFPSYLECEANLKNNFHQTEYKIITIDKSSVIAHDHMVENGSPFNNFTDYLNCFNKLLNDQLIKGYDSIGLVHKFSKFTTKDILPISKLGYKRLKISTKIGVTHLDALNLVNDFLKKKMVNYSVLKDYPTINKVSFISPHLSNGTISPREIFRLTNDYVSLNPMSSKDSAVWLEGFIKREYAHYLAYHYPQALSLPHNQFYKSFPWVNDMDLFNKWCSGATGYPIIDAAMTQLNKFGYIHNRLRLIVSSFLVKNLGIDYRLGEQYFRSKLLDSDIAVNNYNWQYVASVGLDSPPFYRVLNPVLQSFRFDKSGKYIKKYLPLFKDVPSELLHDTMENIESLKSYGIILGENYPLPIVDHKISREHIIYKHNEYTKEESI